MFYTVLGQDIAPGELFVSPRPCELVHTFTAHTCELWTICIVAWNEAASDGRNKLNSLCLHCFTCSLSCLAACACLESKTNRLLVTYYNVAPVQIFGGRYKSLRSCSLRHVFDSSCSAQQVNSSCTLMLLQCRRAAARTFALCSKSADLEAKLQYN